MFAKDYGLSRICFMFWQLLHHYFWRFFKCSIKRFEKIINLYSEERKPSFFSFNIKIRILSFQIFLLSKSFHKTLYFWEITRGINFSFEYKHSYFVINENELFTRRIYKHNPHETSNKQENINRLNLLLFPTSFEKPTPFHYPKHTIQEIESSLDYPTIHQRETWTISKKSIAKLLQYVCRL